MGLKADVDEVLQSWSRSPWWMRAWLILSGFLAISSVASLAETVTKWKGFFKDAVSFYHDWISLPLRNLIAPFGIHIDPMASNMLVLFLIITGGMLRAMTVTTNWKDKADKWSTIAMYPLLIGSILGFLYRVNNAHFMLTWKSVVAYVCGFLLVPIMVRPNFVWLYFLQVFGCFAVVALMAAINSGLSK